MKFCFYVVFLKILSGLESSVDPRAVWSALFTYAILSETLVYEFLRHLP